MIVSFFFYQQKKAGSSSLGCFFFFSDLLGVKMFQMSEVLTSVLCKVANNLGYLLKWVLEIISSVCSECYLEYHFGFDVIGV